MQRHCAASNGHQCVNLKCTYMDPLAWYSEQQTCQLLWQPPLFSVVSVCALFRLGKFGLEVCVLWRTHCGNFAVCMDS